MNTNVRPSISDAVSNLRAACAANANWEVSYFDVKHLNEQEIYYRGRVKEIIAAYRTWLSHAEKHRDIRAIAYAELEGSALKNTLTDFLQVYRTIRLERKFLTDIYIGQMRK